jgi:integrase
VPRITKRFVEGLKAGADATHWDDRLGGFGVRVRASGARSYVYVYRLAGGRRGRLRRLTIAKVGEIAPEQAYRQARQASAAVTGGKDPAGDRAAGRRDLKVSELVALYLTEGPAAKPDKKASSWAIDRSNLQRHVVPLLGRRAAASLTKRDIESFQAKVTAGATKAATRKSGKPRGRIRVRGGGGTAWRATVVLAAMLAWARERGTIDGNPAAGVTLNKLRARERFLTDAEVIELGKALAAAEDRGANQSAIAIIRLLLLTGARRNEIAALQWPHVDFQRSALFLPDSKTGQKTIPLGAPALEILSALHERRAKGMAWVFPAARGTGFSVSVGKVWRMIAKAAGLDRVRLHDLRHSFASAAVAGNASLYIVGRILGHRKAGTTERYSHLALDPIRTVADRTARRLADNLIGRSDRAAVVPIRGRK